MLKEESEKLSKTMKKSAEQTDRRRAELQEYIRKNSALRDKVNKMEAALEKVLCACVCVCVCMFVCVFICVCMHVEGREVFPVHIRGHVHLLCIFLFCLCRLP